MSNVPILPSWAIKILYGIGELLCAILIAYFWGLHQYHLGTKAQAAAQAKVEFKVEMQAAKLSYQTAADLQKQYVYIQGATQTVTKQVPIYVTKEDDSRCTINNGFVSVWNAANQMHPASAGSVGLAEPSDVKLSDVAAQHSQEAGICHATEAQRDALKDYILKLQELYR